MSTAPEDEDDEVISQELLNEIDNEEPAVDPDAADTTDDRSQTPGHKQRLRELRLQRKKMLSELRDEQNREIQAASVCACACACVRVTTHPATSA